MPETVSVTFRDQTTGRINDLLMDEHQACAQSQNLLGFLAGALLDYKDEGVEFTPAIVLCDNLELLLRSFPGSVAHTIGTAPLDPLSGARMLKDCGPLTSQNWFMFIERTDGMQVRYGVFTYFRLPTAIPLHEGIGIDSSRFCILLRKISPNTIEIRGAKGSLLTLIFSTVRDRDSAVLAHPVSMFARSCCLSLGAEPNTDEFQIYLTRLLEAALTMSHGTILSCIKDADLNSFSELRDAVPIIPPLDLYQNFSEFQGSNTAGSILTLQRCEELLQGFLRCDGMIIFDSAGRVLAYRAFYRPDGEAAAVMDVVGGARRRAYEGLKALVGKQLISVLFRSQDGATLHHGGAR